MKITNDIYTLDEFEAWSGAKYNYELIKKSEKDKDFLAKLDEYYPNGISKRELNDILWFDDAFCYQYIDNEYLDDDELEIKKSYYE